jgi:hypothetical protein
LPTFGRVLLVPVYAFEGENSLIFERVKDVETFEKIFQIL